MLRLLLALLMAFPTVQTTSVGGATAATTTPTITLPTGIVAGDKVIIVHPVNEAGGVSTSITWPAGWTKPTNDSSETSGAQNALFIAYRDCDGTEGASISPTLTVAGNYSFACYRISGAPAGAPNVAVHVTDGGASPGAPDPPSLTPAGGAKDYLWIAVTGWDSGLNNWSANPANYTTNVLHFDSSNVAGVAIAGVATGTRQLNAASDDPGAFTLTANDQFCATTIAVAGTDSTVGYPPTKRPARLNGPYDPRGFLLSPFRQYDFTPSVAAVATINISGVTASDESSADATGAETIPVSAVGASDETAALSTATETLSTSVTASDETKAALSASETLSTTVGASDETKAAGTATESYPVTVAGVDESKAASALAESIASSVTGSDESYAALVGQQLANVDAVIGAESETQAASSLGVLNPAVAQASSSGGRRITKYEPINPRRARAAAAKRKLDEERRRLASLKKQEAKVVAEYKAIALPEPDAVAEPVPVSNRARVLEMEMREFAERVAAQNARVKALRKEAEIARREAEDRNATELATELAMQAHAELLAQAEWERIETERMQQEADDDELMQVLLLVHDE